MKISFILCIREKFKRIQGWNIININQKLLITYSVELTCDKAQKVQIRSDFETPCMIL